MRMDRLYFFTHDYNANDAKTPKELYGAIEKLGPLPRYLTHHNCTGKETRLAEPAIEEAKAVYLHARKIANRIMKSEPGLPPLPPTETDPFLGVQTISEWCVDAEKTIKTAKCCWIWTRIKKIPRWIYVLVLFLAALLTCLYYLGWLEPIKAFIYK